MIVDILKEVFFAVAERQNFSVRLNAPFSGTFVPEEFYRKDERVQPIMIEVNRKHYMDEATGRKNNIFPMTFAKLDRMLNEILVYWER